MRASFFDDTNTSTSLPMVSSGHEATIPECGQCGFYKDAKCKSPKLKPKGKGRKNILIVLDSPNEKADSEGKHITGQEEEFLKQILRSKGIDLYKDCIITSSMICKVPNDTKAAKVNQSVKNCRPNLIKLIKEHNPRLIFLMGRYATEMLSYFWRPNDIDFLSLVGWDIPVQKLTKNAWVIPTYHPKDALDQKYVINRKFFIDHVDKGLKLLKTKPHPNGLPDYDSHAIVIRKPNEAIKIIKGVLKEGKPTAFDYETNMLKPDSMRAKIACMSISNGKDSYAFMNFMEIRDVWKRFLKSDVPKIGFNAKFENRWTRRIFKCRIKNWIWDGMNNAHILDCRNGITSLKFQSFVRFGTRDYDSVISKFLSAPNSYDMNRVFEAPENELLKYCAMDSLLERMVWKDQKRELKLKTAK